MKVECCNAQGVCPKARTMIGESTFVNSHSFQCRLLRNVQQVGRGRAQVFGHRSSGQKISSLSYLCVGPVVGGGRAVRGKPWSGPVSPPTGWVAT